MGKGEFFKKAEQMVLDAYGEKHHAVPHLLRTAHWLRELKPGADEAFLIAAVAHDIQRGVDAPGQEKKPPKPKGGFLDNEMLKYHQERDQCKL